MAHVPRAPYGLTQTEDSASGSGEGRRVGVPTVAMSPYGEKPDGPEKTSLVEPERGTVSTDLGSDTVDVPAPPAPLVTGTPQVRSAEPIPTSGRVCPQCQAENGNDSQFCTGCGSRFGESATRNTPDQFALLKQPLPPRPTVSGPVAPPRRGGLDRGQRAIAVIFWGLVSLGGLWAGLTNLNFLTLLVGLLAGAYTVYLWRGGSVVILLLPAWIWVPLAAVTGLRRAFSGRSTLSKAVRTQAPSAVGPATRTRRYMSAYIVAAVAVIVVLGLALSRNMSAGDTGQISANPSAPPSVAEPQVEAVPEVSATPPQVPDPLTSEGAVVPADAAKAELEAFVAQDATGPIVRGQWVAQLSSKSEGIVDTTLQPEPFTVPDILAEHLRLRVDPSYGSLVRLVHLGDWGSVATPASPMWVTVADIDAGSSTEVTAWCEAHFSQPCVSG